MLFNVERLRTMEPNRAWHRHKKGFIVFSLLIASLAVSLFSIICLFSQPLSPRNLTNFNCRPSSGTETFIVAEEVNLVDGMSEDEALKVAYSVLKKTVGGSTEQETKLAKPNSLVNEEGLWNVTFSWAWTPYGLPVRVIQYWSLEVLIDPVSQIVVYAMEETTAG